MAFATNGSEVDEDIVARIAGNEAEALGGVEPLDGPGIPVGHVIVLRRGRWRRAVEADGQVKNDGDHSNHQAEQDGRMAPDFRHGRQEGEGLYDNSQHQQRTDQVLQLMTRAFVPVRDYRCERQVKKAEQGQVQGVVLFQVGQAFRLQARNKGQQQRCNAR